MRIRVFSALAAALLSAGALWANIGPGPGVRPGNLPVALNLGAHEAKLVVEVDEKAKEARLEIPQGLLVVGAAQPVPPPKKGLGDAGRGLPIFVVGLSLTGALVSGGLWLARRRRTALLGIAVAAAMLGGAAALIANVPPPPRPKTIPVTLPAGVELPAKLTLQVTLKGDAVKLIVPKGKVLKAVEAKPEE